MGLCLLGRLFSFKTAARRAHVLPNTEHARRTRIPGAGCLSTRLLYSQYPDVPCLTARETETMTGQCNRPTGKAPCRWQALSNGAGGLFCALLSSLCVAGFPLFSC